MALWEHVTAGSNPEPDGWRQMVSRAQEELYSSCSSSSFITLIPSMSLSVSSFHFLYCFFEEFILLGYNAVRSVESQPTFRRNFGWLSGDYTALCPRR
jgi:hypothetical protein